MVFVTVFALIFGFITGTFFKSNELIMSLTDLSTPTLYLLIFSAGLSVGFCKTAFKSLSGKFLNALIYPIAIVLGAFISSVILSLIPNFLPFNSCLSISCGFCWYSLSSSLVTELSGSAKVGTICLLSNLIRELLAFILIPITSKKYGISVGLCFSGTTAQDTALPFIIKYNGEDCAIYCLLSGVVCSLLVPFLVRISYLL